MRRLMVGAVLAGVMLVMPQAAGAQPQAGDRDVLIFANLTSISGGGFNSTSGNLFFNIGQYLTERFEIGGGPSVTISRTSFGANGSSTSDTDIGIGANGFVRLYFGQSSGTIKPYLGAEIVFNRLNPEDGQSIGDQTFLAGTGGLKNYLSENAALDIKASYGFQANDPAAFKLFTVTVGLTYLF